MVKIFGASVQLALILLALRSSRGTIGIPRKSSSPPTWFRGKYPVVATETPSSYTNIPHSSEQPLPGITSLGTALSDLLPKHVRGRSNIVLDLDASESAGYTAQGQSRGP
ncbi:hypothetical protein B0H17DRAFT_1143971 [Mycena rosella]|uniref:Secreted protein n=1 Tax=Mycena rosella TaxID=1033263 RepID=A0AAD7G7K4_MYCRO|nr:hypothetical protein B0H17DRAFT_1143971 [Mycena rosella]